MSNEEYDALVDRLKTVFRTKDDCEEKHDEVSTNVHMLESKFAVVTTKLNMLLAILGCIGAAVVGILLRMIIGG